MRENIFSEKVDLNKIHLPKSSYWIRISFPEKTQDKRELYNEKNYFYQFVHEALYDEGMNDGIILHFERKELMISSKVKYCICFGEDNWVELDVLSISLNLYSTGVGVLNFYLLNEEVDSINIIRKINDLGRKVYPPYFDLEHGIAGTKNNGSLAHMIKITGLMEAQKGLTEDFLHFKENDTWKPSIIISTLLKDFTSSNNLVIEPVIDDRMFVTCWIGNDSIAEKVKNEPKWFLSEEWYKILFLDSNYSTCQNDELRHTLLNASTDMRWQKYGTLYGVTRYSFLALMENNEYTRKVFLTHLRTIYFRMVELCLVQRASMLHFADEVTEISHLRNARTDKVDKYVSSLFKEYIRFVNKIYFREISGQDQAIELYDLLQDQMRIRDHVTNLEREIQELHNYITLLESKEQNKKLALLTLFGVMFVVPTFIIGYYGMNNFEDVNNYKNLGYFDILLLTLVFSLGVGILWKHKIGRFIFFILAGLILLILLFFDKLF